MIEWHGDDDGEQSRIESKTSTNGESLRRDLNAKLDFADRFAATDADREWLKRHRETINNNNFYDDGIVSEDARDNYMAEIDGAYSKAMELRGFGGVMKDALDRGLTRFGAGFAHVGVSLADNLGAYDYGEADEKRRKIHEWQDRSEVANPKAVGSYKDVEGVGGAMTFALESFLENSPTMLAAIGLGAATGGTAGAVLAGGVFGAQNYGEAVEDQLSEGRDFSQGAALGQAAGYTALDVGIGGAFKLAKGTASAVRQGSIRAAREAMRKTALAEARETAAKAVYSQTAGKAMRNVAKEVLKDTGMEAITEPMQSQIVGRLTRYGQTGEWFSPEERERIANGESASRIVVDATMDEALGAASATLLSGGVGGAAQAQRISRMHSGADRVLVNLGATRDGLGKYSLSAKWGAIGAVAAGDLDNTAGGGWDAARIIAEDVDRRAKTGTQTLDLVNQVADFFSFDAQPDAETTERLRKEAVIDIPRDAAGNVVWQKGEDGKYEWFDAGGGVLIGHNLGKVDEEHPEYYVHNNATGYTLAGREPADPEGTSLVGAVQVAQSMKFRAFTDNVKMANKRRAAQQAMTALNAGEFEVYDTVGKMLEAHPEMSHEGAFDSSARGFNIGGRNGTRAIVLSNIHSIGELYEAVYHEKYIHGALRNLMADNEERNKFLKEVGKLVPRLTTDEIRDRREHAEQSGVPLSRNDEFLNDFNTWRNAIESTKDSRTGQKVYTDEAEIIEETLAYLAQREALNPDGAPGLMDYAAKWVNKKLRGLGVNLNMTANDYAVLCDRLRKSYDTGRRAEQREMAAPGPAPLKVSDTSAAPATPTPAPAARTGVKGFLAERGVNLAEGGREGVRAAVDAINRDGGAEAQRLLDELREMLPDDPDNDLRALVPQKAAQPSETKTPARPMAEQPQGEGRAETTPPPTKETTNAAQPEARTNEAPAVRPETDADRDAAGDARQEAEDAGAEVRPPEGAEAGDGGGAAPETDRGAVAGEGDETSGRQPGEREEFPDLMALADRINKAEIALDEAKTPEERARIQQELDALQEQYREGQRRARAATTATAPQPRETGTKTKQPRETEAKADRGEAEKETAGHDAEAETAAMDMAVDDAFERVRALLEVDEPEPAAIGRVARDMASSDASPAAKRAVADSFENRLRVLGVSGSRAEIDDAASAIRALRKAAESTPKKNGGGAPRKPPAPRPTQNQSTRKPAGKQRPASADTGELPKQQGAGRGKVSFGKGGGTATATATPAATSKTGAGTRKSKAAQRREADKRRTALKALAGRTFTPVNGGGDITIVGATPDGNFKVRQKVRVPLGENRFDEREEERVVGADDLWQMWQAAQRRRKDAEKRRAKREASAKELNDAIDEYERRTGDRASAMIVRSMLSGRGVIHLPASYKQLLIDEQAFRTAQENGMPFNGRPTVERNRPMNNKAKYGIRAEWDFLEGEVDGMRVVPGLNRVIMSDRQRLLFGVNPFEEKNGEKPKPMPGSYVGSKLGDTSAGATDFLQDIEALGWEAVSGDGNEADRHDTALSMIEHALEVADRIESGVAEGRTYDEIFGVSAEEEAAREEEAEEREAEEAFDEQLAAGLAADIDAAIAAEDAEAMDAVAFVEGPNGYWRPFSRGRLASLKPGDVVQWDSETGKYEFVSFDNEDGAGAGASLSVMAPANELVTPEGYFGGDIRVFAVTGDDVTEVTRPSAQQQEEDSRGEEGEYGEVGDSGATAEERGAAGREEAEARPDDVRARNAQGGQGGREGGGEQGGVAQGASRTGAEAGAGGFALESVSQQDLDREAKDRATRAEIERRQAEPIRGDAGETGQTLLDLGGLASVQSPTFASTRATRTVQQQPPETPAQGEGGFALEADNAAPTRRRSTNADMEAGAASEGARRDAEAAATARAIGIVDATREQVAEKRQQLGMLRELLSEARGFRTALADTKEGNTARMNTLNRRLAQTEEVVGLLKERFGLEGVSNDETAEGETGIDARIRGIAEALAWRDRQIEAEERDRAISDDVEGAAAAMPEIDTGRFGFREAALGFLTDLVDLAQSYREWVPPAQTGGESVEERRAKAHTPANNRKWLDSPFRKTWAVPEEEEGGDASRIPMAGVGAVSEDAADEATEERMAEEGKSARGGNSVADEANPELARRQLLADGANYQERKVGGKTGRARRRGLPGAGEDTRTVRDVLESLLRRAAARAASARALQAIASDPKNSDSALPRALVLDALDFYRNIGSATQPSVGNLSGMSAKAARERREKFVKEGRAKSIAQAQGAAWFLENGFPRKAKDGETARVTMADGRKYAVPVKNASTLTKVEAAALARLGESLEESANRSLSALTAMEGVRVRQRSAAGGLAEGQTLFSRGDIAAELAGQARELSDVETRFSIRLDPPPEKTGVGYKVFYRGRDGKLYPPMIANPGGADTPVGVWLDADAAPVAGMSKTGRPQVKQGGKGTQGGSGTLAYRPGWHLGEIPYAIQFNRRDENGERTLFPKDFVWAEVEYAANIDYQKEAEAEGYTESGKFRHSYAGLKRLPKDGFYRYRTNVDPNTDPWIITGAMKVNKVLTNDEVDALVRKAGREPQRREGDTRFSISGLYTGGSADYAERIPVLDKDGNVTGWRIDNAPSLKHVGTGEGSQVYGWGLYASAVRGVAERYAGVRPSGQADEWMIPGVDEGLMSRGRQDALSALKRFRNLNEARNRLIEVKERTGDAAKRRRAMEALRSLEKDNWTPRGSRIYEQTFFTNRADGEETERHLLKWYEPVSREQVRWVVDEARAEGVYDRLAYVFNLKKQWGGDLYENIAKHLGPRGTSEFLARAGIDGVKYPVDSYRKPVKDGDVAGWNYVSFRDDNIRVDHKWVDGKTLFSRSDILNRPADSVVQSIVDAHNASARGAAPAPGIMDRPETRLERFRRRNQDAMLPVKNWVDDLGGVSAKDNPYYAEDRRYGKDDHQTRELFRAAVSPILDECDRRNVALSDLNRYLAAKFAGERNKMIADRTAGVKSDGSGLGDIEADAILKRYRANGMEADLDAVAQMVWKMNRDTLDRLVDAGLLAKAQADKWKELSQHYVPLRTMLENEDFDASEVSAAITKLESKHALGRNTVADSPFVFSILQAEQAIVRANKNEVRQKVAAIVRAHPETGRILEGQPLKRTLVRDSATGEYRVRYTVNRNFRERRAEKDTLGEDNVIQFKEDGELKYIVLNGERGKLIARAITKYGMEKIESSIGETARRFNRILANTRTSWSPTFLLRNFGYDTQQVLITMNMDGFHKESLLYGKYVASGSALRAAHDYYKHGTYGGELGWAMREFAENGGLIKGGTSQGWDETNDYIADELGGAETAAGRAKKAFIERFERANSSIETQTRLAVYAALRRGGMGVEEAISYARDVTVNFNRKGERGQIINNWWMFANAGIQDVERIARSLFGNEARRHGKANGAIGSRAATIAALLAFGIIQGLAGGDDDDDEMDNMTDYSKQSSWYRRIGKTPYYFRIGRRGPYNIVPYIGQRLTEVFLGKGKAEDAAADIAEYAWSLALDPTNSSQIMRADNGRSIDVVDTLANTVAPTLVAPLAQAATDRTFTGDELTRKRFNKNLPASHNGKEATSSLAKGVAKAVNSATGGDEYTAGLVDLPPEYYELFVSSILGSLGSDAVRTFGTTKDILAGDVNPERIPFVRDFVRKIPDNTRRYYEATTRQGGYETSAKGYRKDKDWAKVREFEEAHPSARPGVSKRLADMEKRIKELRDVEAHQEGDAQKRTHDLRTRMQGEYIRLLGD